MPCPGNLFKSSYLERESLWALGMVLLLGHVVSGLLNVYLYTYKSVQLSDLLREAFVCRGQWLMTRRITGHSAAECSALKDPFLSTSPPSLLWSMTIMGRGRGELLEDGWGGVL